MSTKHDRATVELDRETLKALARQATGEQAVVVETQEDTPSSPRTQTLQDPLTAALLAEVARSSRTRDFEDESPTAEVVDNADLPHPNLKRR